MSHWTTEQKDKAMAYGICHICGAPREVQMRTTKDGDETIHSHGLVCEQGHSASQVAVRHKWGPWISRHDLWAGEAHRHCSCGLIQFLTVAESDPHTEAGAGT